MARWKRKGSTSDKVMTAISLLTFPIVTFRKFAYMAKSFVDVLEYRYWLASTFGIRKVFLNRASMMDFLVGRITRTQSAKIIIEFGVAFGETFRFLIDNLSGDFEYHGFDTFEGLPRSWRNLPQGAISAGGSPPNYRSN